MSSHDENVKEASRMGFWLVIATIAMFAFAVVALPPLYDVFCEVTGLGGRTNETPAEVTVTVVEDRQIRLEFDTTVNQYAPWEFSSDRDSMTIQPGGIYETTFSARNLADRNMIAQAVPSVAPPQAAKYFKKLDCFCFTDAGVCSARRTRYAGALHH